MAGWARGSEDTSEDLCLTHGWGLRGIRCLSRMTQQEGGPPNSKWREVRMGANGSSYPHSCSPRIGGNAQTQQTFIGRYFMSGLITCPVIGGVVNPVNSDRSFCICSPCMIKYLCVWWTISQTQFSHSLLKWSVKTIALNPIWHLLQTHNVGLTHTLDQINLLPWQLMVQKVNIVVHESSWTGPLTHTNDSNVLKSNASTFLSHVNFMTCNEGQICKGMCVQHWWLTTITVCIWSFKESLKPVTSFRLLVSLSHFSTVLMSLSEMLQLEYFCLNFQTSFRVWKAFF